MTAVRLSPLQRQVLEQLAHIRVRREDAWLGTERLRVLTGATRRTLFSLMRRDLIELESALHFDAWRITDKGREALG